MHYLIALLGGLAYGVYLDATKHKIGRVPGEDLADNHSAGGWAARALLIAPTIVYYRKRPKLLERAAEHPVEAPHARRNKILILAGLMTAVFLASAGGGGNIDAVRNGILEFNQATTLGEALENYSHFREVVWEEGATANGMHFVNAVGDLDLERLPKGESLRKKGVTRVKALFQFMILRDGESFEYNAFEMHVQRGDGEVQKLNAGAFIPDPYAAIPEPDDALQRIYDDAPLIR